MLSIIVKGLQIKTIADGADEESTINALDEVLKKEGLAK